MSAKSEDSVFVRMMKTGEFSDLKFTCNGEEFKVHKAVICLQSPVIRAAVEGGFEESHTNIIKMDAFLCETVERLIQFMYTGDYDDPTYYIQIPLTDYKDCLSSTSIINGGVAALLETQLRTAKDSQTESCQQELSSESWSKATACLVEHVRANYIGTYYGINGLVSLANAKIKSLLDSEDRSWVTSLPAATEAVIKSTEDKELQQMFASATIENISTLLDFKQFKRLGLITDFSDILLNDYAKRLYQTRCRLHQTEEQLNQKVKQRKKDLILYI